MDSDDFRHMHCFSTPLTEPYSFTTNTPSRSHCTREEVPIEPSSSLHAIRLVGNQRWQANVDYINQHGIVIGHAQKSRYGDRVQLGYAMGCVKAEDTVLLPLGLWAEYAAIPLLLGE